MTKVSALTEDTNISDDDILYKVDNPGGTPLSRKITWANIKAVLKTYFDTFYTWDQDAIDVPYDNTASWLSATNVKTAIDEVVSNALATIILKWNWDASVWTFPASTKAWWSYIVSVAWTVDWVDFNINDRLISILDNASTTVYAGNWIKADYTDQVISVNTQTWAVVLDADDIGETAARKFLNVISQTFTWIKTFASFPITPSSAPTTNYQVANKKYVDDAGWWASYPSIIYTSASSTSTANSTVYSFTHNLWLSQSDVQSWKYKVVITSWRWTLGNVWWDNSWWSAYWGDNFAWTGVSWNAAAPADTSLAHLQANTAQFKSWTSWANIDNYRFHVIQNFA